MVADIIHQYKSDAWQKAMRHSKLVDRLRVILPIIAILLTVFFAIRLIVSLSVPVGATLGEFALYDGKLVMNNPKLSGVSKANEPYKLEAVRAIQNVGDDSQWIMEEIYGEFEIDDGDRIRFITKNAVYNRDTEILVFDNPVAITIDAENGFADGKINFLKAFIDIPNSALHSEDAVKMKWDKGELTANAFKTLENGKILVFEKFVKTTLEPKDNGQSSEETSQASQEFINNEEVIHIDSHKLKIIDEEKKLVYQGNIQVNQGNNRIETDELIVHYNEQAKKQDIHKLEFVGNVIITQGDNNAQGCKLIVNMLEDVAELKACGERVNTIINTDVRQEDNQ